MGHNAFSLTVPCDNDYSKRMSWRDLLPNFIIKQWDQIFKKIEVALVQFTPAYIKKNNSLFSPIIALIALVNCIILAGIAIGSFFTLLASLLVLYFILTKVFGIQFDQGDIFVV